MGEERLQALLQESLAVAARTEAMKPTDLSRVIIDTTVQPKAVIVNRHAIGTPDRLRTTKPQGKAREYVGLRLKTRDDREKE